MAAAALAAGRGPSSIGLLAVSKTFGAEAVIAARAEGQRAFGESYVQEAVGKIAQVADPGIEWHFIGPLQSNKTRAVAEHFDWVHSVSSLKIARRLSDQRPANRGPLSVCLQVNVSGEATKAGISEAELPALAREVASLPGLRLRGLMCIPAPAEGFDARRVPFAELARMQQRLLAAGVGGADVLPPPAVVHLIGPVDDDEARFRALIGAGHHAVPHADIRPGI